MHEDALAAEADLAAALPQKLNLPNIQQACSKVSALVYFPYHVTTER
jgi:hypothetical protein